MQIGQQHRYLVPVLLVSISRRQRQWKMPLESLGMTDFSENNDDYNLLDEGSFAQDDDCFNGDDLLNSSFLGSSHSEKIMDTVETSQPTGPHLATHLRHDQQMDQQDDAAVEYNRNNSLESSYNNNFTFNEFNASNSINSFDASGAGTIAEVNISKLSKSKKVDSTPLSPTRKRRSPTQFDTLLDENTEQSILIDIDNGGLMDHVDEKLSGEHGQSTLGGAQNWSLSKRNLAPTAPVRTESPNGRHIATLTFKDDTNERPNGLFYLQQQHSAYARGIPCQNQQTSSDSVMTRNVNDPVSGVFNGQNMGSFREINNQIMSQEERNIMSSASNMSFHASSGMYHNPIVSPSHMSCGFGPNSNNITSVPTNDFKMLPLSSVNISSPNHVPTQQNQHQPFHGSIQNVPNFSQLPMSNDIDSINHHQYRQQQLKNLHQQHQHIQSLQEQQGHDQILHQQQRQAKIEQMRIEASKQQQQHFQMQMRQQQQFSHQQQPFDQERQIEHRQQMHLQQQSVNPLAIQQKQQHLQQLHQQQVQQKLREDQIRQQQVGIQPALQQGMHQLGSNFSLQNQHVDRQQQQFQPKQPQVQTQDMQHLVQLSPTTFNMQQQMQRQLQMKQIQQSQQVNVQRENYQQNRPLGLSQTVHQPRGCKYQSQSDNEGNLSNSLHRGQQLILNSFGSNNLQHDVGNPNFHGPSPSASQSFSNTMDGMTLRQPTPIQTQPTLNLAMEKLCDSMKRSAMSRSMIRQISGKTLGSHSGHSTNRGILSREGSFRGGGGITRDGSFHGVARKLSMTKHHLQHSGSRTVHRHQSGEPTSPGFNLHVDGKNVGTI